MRNVKGGGMLAVDGAVYAAKAGDTWDLISFKAREEETLMRLLIAANPNLSHIVVFEGGEKVRIPEIPESTNTESLPPWRQ